MWRLSMEDCPESTTRLDDIISTAYTFFGTVGFENTLRTNYDAQKASIDEQWMLMLFSYNNKSYFNAGMFEGRIWTMLSTGAVFWFLF